MPQYFLGKQLNITSVDLTGTNTAEIADYFCYNSWYLTSVTIASPISKIDNCVCMNSSAGHGRITSITIPNSVTTIGTYFLENQDSLTSLTIPSSVTTIGTHFATNTKLTSITIPSSVTSLGNYCLENCGYLTQLIYNAPTSSLPQYLCRQADALELVDLNSSVATITRQCFDASSTNTNLLEVVLRKTDDIVTLTNVLGSTSSNAAFRYRQNIKIYVPTSLIASYQANSNWAAGITAGYLTIVALEGSQYE